MKKMFVTLAALALAAAALAVPATAHGHGGWNGDCRQAVSCLDADGTCGRGNYADEDGDGVCDNCGTACGYRHYADEDGDGSATTAAASTPCSAMAAGTATMAGDTAAGK